MKRADRALRVMIGVSALGGLGFWAPNHIALNQQIWKEGRPWGQAGFKRGGRTITSAADYLTQYWYLGANTLVSGVPYKTRSILPGTDKPTDPPGAAYPIADWNGQGGLWEDGFVDVNEATKWGGRRAVNHFHDPLLPNGGYTGITPVDLATGIPFIDLARVGISVTDWAMNGESGGMDGKNVWGYPTIGESFQRVFTEATPAMRGSALAAGFRALGQVEHLIEDNAVPDHTRNLPHPGDGFEEYLAGLGDKKKTSRPVDWFGAFRGQWLEFPLKAVEQGGLRAIWDRDVFNGFDPESTLTGPMPGISEYTCANFFAWNRFVIGPIVYDFTTLPSAPGQPGYQINMVWGPSPMAMPPLTFFWPQLGPLTGDSYDFGGRTIPFSPSAVVGENVYTGIKKPILDASVWAQYAQPLMAAAHGYPQTALALALPPARAEIVPSRQGNFLEFVVRIWNLWPADSPHAVTWHLDDVSIKGIHADLFTGIATFAPNAHTVPGAGRDLAPGGLWESAPFTLTTQEQFTLTHSSHVGVLVKAHLGTDKQTPLVFSIPIPNGFAVVQQTSGRSTSATSSYTVTSCCSSDCNPVCGQTATLHQPWTQTVSGTIKLYPTQKDILGHPADDVTNQAMAADTRIAGVALLAYPRFNQDLTKPVPATASTLQLVGSSLSPISNGGANQALWLRTADAKDEADPAATTAITFNATIDLHDFYFADQGQPPADASRASRGVFLAVWTTAGGLQVTPLLLWPIGNDKLASGIVPVDRQCSDSYYFPGAGHSSTFIQVGGEDEQGCYGFLNTNDKGMCTGQAFMWSRSAIWAPDGLPIGTEALNILDAVYLLHYGFLEPRTVGGLPAPLMPVDGGINVVPACTAAELTAYVQDGGTKVCGGVPLLAYKNVTTAMTDTPCANYPAGPALPRTATYERTMKLEAPFFDAVLGRSPPPTYQLTLN